MGFRRALFAATLAALPLTATAADLQGAAWVTDGMQRVRPTAAAGTATSINLQAGRGETIALQAIVNATSGRLTNVRVAASDLTGPGTIAKTNVTLYRERYTFVPSQRSYSGGSTPLPSGRYPDGLIPFVNPATGLPITNAQIRAQPFSVSAGRNQPIWADVAVPRTATPGNYTGSLIITSDQGSATLGVNLQVWRFTLPLVPSLDSLFPLRSTGGLSAQREILRHRLMPVPSPRYEPSLIGMGLKSNDLGFWSGADAHTCRMSSPPSQSELRGRVEAHLPAVRLYNYTADEITHCPGLNGTVRQWGAALHGVGVKQLIVMVPTSELYDSVDIWPILPLQYDRTRPHVPAVVARGGEVWSYNTMNQDSFSPKWAVDFSPIEFRIFGLINQSLGLPGLLYWCVDCWSGDPWESLYTSSYGDRGYAGEGTIVYPGAKVGISGVVPTMRIKWLRDAVQDYEYVEQLKKLGRGNWALATIRDIAPDFRNWTRDPQRLLAVREALGEELNRLTP